MEKLPIGWDITGVIARKQIPSSAPVQRKFMEVIHSGLYLTLSMAGRRGPDSENHNDPNKCISPVGWGTPPAGSSVTANFCALSVAESEGTFRNPVPSGPTWKIPASMGLLSAIIHN